MVISGMVQVFAKPWTMPEISFGGIVSLPAVNVLLRYFVLNKRCGNRIGGGKGVNCRGRGLVFGGKCLSLQAKSKLMQCRKRY